MAKREQISLIFHVSCPYDSFGEVGLDCGWNLSAVKSAGPTTSYIQEASPVRATVLAGKIDLYIQVVTIIPRFLARVTKISEDYSFSYDLPTFTLSKKPIFLLFMFSPKQAGQNIWLSTKYHLHLHLVSFGISAVDIWGTLIKWDRL